MRGRAAHGIAYVHLLNQLFEHLGKCSLLVLDQFHFELLPFVLFTQSLDLSEQILVAQALGDVLFELVVDLFESLQGFPIELISSLVGVSDLSLPAFIGCSFCLVDMDHQFVVGTQILVDALTVLVVRVLKSASAK